MAEQGTADPEPSAKATTKATTAFRMGQNFDAAALSPSLRRLATSGGYAPARRVWRATASTRPSGPHMVASSTANPSLDRGERHER